MYGPQADRTTFEELCEFVLDDYRRNQRKSRRRVEICIKHLTEFFGRYRAVDITPDVLRRYAFVIG